MSAYQNFVNSLLKPFESWFEDRTKRATLEAVEVMEKIITDFKEELKRKL